MLNGRPELEHFRDLIEYNYNADGAVLTDNNDIKIYTNGKKKFRDLLSEMKKARRYIHLQYYIIRDDELWKRIERILRQKVRQGVEVRVLFDGLGCRHIHRGKWKRLRKEGIQTARSEGVIRKDRKRKQTAGKIGERLNCRNHRKIAVIDGRVGFLGGYNIGLEYLGKDQKFGYWRDTHICLEGSAVTTLVLCFCRDWYYATGENLSLKEYLFDLPEYFRSGKNAVQIISSGPDSKRPLIRDNYLYLIRRAKNSILIQTPYFIPDQEIKSALLHALDRGVTVSIMIPCKPDHPFVYWATCSYIREMLLAGARCYRYEKGFLHAKCMCVDKEVTCIGSANMDIRSFRLNCEVNAMIFNRNLTEQYTQIFRKDCRQCTKITKEIYDKCTVWIRILEKIGRFLSPVL